LGRGAPGGPGRHYQADPAEMLTRPGQRPYD